MTPWAEAIPITTGFINDGSCGCYIYGAKGTHDHTREYAFSPHLDTLAPCFKVPICVSSCDIVITCNLVALTSHHALGGSHDVNTADTGEPSCHVQAEIVSSMAKHELN